MTGFASWSAGADGRAGSRPWRRPSSGASPGCGRTSSRSSPGCRSWAEASQWRRRGGWRQGGASPHKTCCPSPLGWSNSRCSTWKPEAAGTGCRRPFASMAGWCFGPAAKPSGSYERQAPGPNSGRATGSALSLLQAALDELPPDDQQRRDLLDQLAWQAECAGSYRLGAEALQALDKLLTGESDLAARATVQLRLSSFLPMAGGDLEAAEEALNRAL